MCNCFDPFLCVKGVVVLTNSCISKKEASLLLGVTIRMIDYYLQRGNLLVDHMEKGRVMIDVSEVYSLREKRKRRI